MIRAFLSGWLLLNLLLAPPSAKNRSKGRATQSKPKSAISKPFTIDRVVSRLANVAHGDYTEVALIRKIEKDGIDFQATPDNLARLEKAGASNSLISSVKHLAPPPPPTPVIPVVITGAVQLVCAPAECLVTFGGSPATSTVGGALLRRNLEPGSVSITASKDGYIPFTSLIKVGPRETATVNVDLKPTLNTRMMWGAQLESKMVQALGSDDGLQQSRSVLSFGDATIWGHDGRKYSSSLEMLVRPIGKAFFRARAGKSSLYEVEFLPSFRSKSNLGEDEARDMEAGLRLIRKYQISAVFERLSAPGVQVLADKNDLEDGAVFIAKSSTGELSIVMDADRRPKEIQEELPFGPGIRALYSGYQLHGKAYIPGDVSILWPGSPKQGIAVQFHSFELNPDLKKDSWYRVKRRTRS